MNDKSAMPPQLTVLLSEAGSVRGTAHMFKSVEEAVLHCLEKNRLPAVSKIDSAAPGDTSVFPAPQ